MSREISDAERWLAAIVESSDDAIIGESLEGVVTSWNRGAERISGYMAQDVLGRRCREKFLIDMDLTSPIACGEACQLTDCMREGQPREADVLLRHRAGHRIPVHVSAVPLRDSKNKIVGTCAARYLAGQTGSYKRQPPHRVRCRTLPGERRGNALWRQKGDPEG